MDRRVVPAVARRCAAPLLLAVLVACGDAEDPPRPPAPEGASAGAGAEISARPSFSCIDPASEAEDVICSDPELARLDVELSEVFAEAVASTSTMADGAAAASELRAYQRGWIAGRDDCWKAEDVRTCVYEMYVRRIAELRARFVLVEATNTVYWSCDGNPADEFVTTFFPTDPRTVRIERGDRTEIGVQTPTASGARYDASFGVYFWNRGQEALFEWPQGEEHHCVVRRRSDGP